MLMIYNQRIQTQIFESKENLQVLYLKETNSKD